VARLKTISQFKSALSGGGARPNLFEVELTTFPSGISWDADKFKYLCKAAALPASNVASIDVPFRGRTFKVAGDRTIDAWTVTIINDEDFKLRRAFEAWTELIAKLDNNLGATQPAAYMSNATVYQLGRGAQVNSTTSAGSDSSILAAYKFVDIFPTSVSNIDLSYDSGDTIEEFTVEFQVQSYEIISGNTAAKA
jgi:hypothetical protein